jgi:hypothetical protein
VTADDLFRIYAAPIPPVVDTTTLARHFKESVTFLSLPSGDLSAADILLKLLHMPARYVDGPTAAGTTTYKESTIPAFVFDSTVQDVRSFIETNHRLPSEVFVGSQTLSLADFAATLGAARARDRPDTGCTRQTRLRAMLFHRRGFKWPIHPEGFAPEELLDLARLQGWTLKPARLR